MQPYPVDLSVPSPARYDRVQLAIRIAIGLVLGFVGVTGGWLWCLLYLALPVIAATAISLRGAPAYREDVGPTVWWGLTWLLDVGAYMMLLVDRFPAGERACQVELRSTGTPTPGKALARLVTSIPAAFILGVLAIVGGVLAVVGWITILAAERVPTAILRYQQAVLRGTARLFAYHAALVAEYPPFGLDVHDAPIPGARAAP
jgi:hypothetical protein